MECCRSSPGLRAHPHPKTKCPTKKFCRVEISASASDPEHSRLLLGAMVKSFALTDTLHQLREGLGWKQAISVPRREKWLSQPIVTDAVGGPFIREWHTVQPLHGRIPQRRWSHCNDNNRAATIAPPCAWVLAPSARWLAALSPSSSVPGPAKRLPRRYFVSLPEFLQWNSSRPPPWVVSRLRGPFRRTPGGRSRRSAA